MGVRSPSGGSSFPCGSEETDDEIGTVVDEDDVVEDDVVDVEDVVVVVEDIVVVVEDVVDEEDDATELEETGGTYSEETEEDIGAGICEEDPPEEAGSVELLSGGIDELSADVAFTDVL